MGFYNAKMVIFMLVKHHDFIEDFGNTRMGWITLSLIEMKE